MKNIKKYNKIAKKNTSVSTDFVSSFDSDTLDESCSSVSIFSVKVRSSIVRDASVNQCKALAVHSIVRANESRTNRRTDSYMMVELHKLTGLHYETIKKAVEVLKPMGLVEVCDDGKIRFKKAKSGNSQRNVKITVTIGKKCFDKAYHEILKARIVNKLRQMQYYADASHRLDEVLSSEHKGTCKEIKELRKVTVEHRQQRCNGGSETQSFGLSYAKMSDFLGVSVKTCQKLIKELCTDGIITKKNRRERVKCSHKSQLDYIEYTFLYRGYVYKVYANEYGIVSKEK